MGKFTQSVLGVSLEPKVEPIKLVEKGSVTINSGDTSTSSVKIKDCSFELKDNCLYYFVCKKSQTPNSGLFSNETITQAYYMNSSATTLSGASAGVKTMYTNGEIGKTSTASLGITATINSGKMSVYKKYNSNTTPNWAGIYDYKIYEIDLSKLGE